MESSTLIESSLKKDGALILDAVRRLYEGTWHLCDEDSDWTNHLFPPLKEALLDHITFENSCVLPALSREAAQLHEMDHERILSLIWSIEAARERSSFKHFHSLLRVLFSTIDQHYLVFGECPTDISSCDSTCVGNKIIARAKRTNLEYK